MSLKPPFTELEITKEPSGFYEGTSLPIALISKISMTALVLWALIAPGNASKLCLTSRKYSPIMFKSESGISLCVSATLPA